MTQKIYYFLGLLRTTNFEMSYKILELLLFMDGTRKKLDSLFLVDYVIAPLPAFIEKSMIDNLSKTKPGFLLY